MPVTRSMVGIGERRGDRRGGLLVARREEHRRRRQRARVVVGSGDVEAVLLQFAGGGGRQPVLAGRVRHLHGDVRRVGGDGVDQLAGVGGGVGVGRRRLGRRARRRLGCAGHGCVVGVLLLGQRVVVDDRVEDCPVVVRRAGARCRHSSMYPVVGHGQERDPSGGDALNATGRGRPGPWCSMLST